MPRVRVCIVCGVPTSNGSRCAKHHGGHRNPAYDSHAWRKLRERTLKEWRAEHGNLCPGYRRPPHVPTTRLTVDHITPLVLGGSITGPVRVLCASCNSTAGMSEPGMRRGQGYRRLADAADDP